MISRTKPYGRNDAEARYKRPSHELDESLQIIKVVWQQGMASSERPELITIEQAVKTLLDADILFLLPGNYPACDPDAVMSYLATL